MIGRLLLIGLCTFSASVSAMQPVHPPGFLPTETARPLLEQDPGVAAARAGLDVARQEAGILDNSPYEWIARGSGQQRKVQSGPRYNEWSVGIERTFRLPGKAIADRNLGAATVNAAEARYRDAQHEAARELAGLWVEWLAGESARKLAERNLQSVQESLAAVEKRVRAGDASKLDANIARAELAEQRRLENDAKTQAAIAWARLSTRFPGVAPQPPTLPIPTPITEDVAFWRERILAQSDALKIAQTQIQMDQAQAERARRDRIPDPTLGLQTASEIGGQEHITGVVLSLPIPGQARRLRSAKAAATVEVSRREFAFKQRQFETEIASAVASARGAYNSLQIANESTLAMEQNAALMQRAYTLGEADLQSLLLARRQATAAMNNALQVQVTVLKAYYGLLVDAHLIWDLEHD